jgi:hypothetical protein
VCANEPVGPDPLPPSRRPANRLDGLTSSLSRIGSRLRRRSTSSRTLWRIVLLAAPEGRDLQSRDARGPHHP